MWRVILNLKYILGEKNIRLIMLRVSHSPSIFPFLVSSHAPKSFPIPKGGHVSSGSPFPSNVNVYGSFPFPRGTYPLRNIWKQGGNYFPKGNIY